MTLSDEARKSKAAYQREYRKHHREQYNAYNRKWRSKHKAKVNQYNEKYWEKKAAQFKENDNPIQQFIKKKCTVQSGLSISNKELSQAFNGWNNSDISTTKFALEFKDIALQLGLLKKRTKHGMMWEGVGLKL